MSAPLQPSHPSGSQQPDAETLQTQQCSPQEANQFQLLRQRRFAPFFWTQFAGAANDNLFKFALTVMVTYQLQVSWLPAGLAGLVIGAVFILPFLLFSATAGQMADKYEHSLLFQRLKLLEIGIMAVAAIAFWQSWVALLLACVFLMGVQSTFFGPAKYAYLPQQLRPAELTGGNGMVEMGTFVAIVLGSLAGAALVESAAFGRLPVALACLAVAALGYASSMRIPTSPATDADLRIDWNPLRVTWANLRLAHGNTVVFRSLLGISWMWFIGSVLMSQFPAIAKEVLHGSPPVASLLLTVFALGIGIGSLLCEVLSRRQVEIGLVPVGALGMSLFLADLYFATRGLPRPDGLLSVAQFLGQGAHWRVMTDLLLLCLCTGLYSVPMYALVQMRAAPTHRARIIAANNIMNALFMVASALIAGALLQAGLSIPQLFLALAVANTIVAGYIFLLVPEYLLRFIAWVLTHLAYRFRVDGREHIPASGPAVLACNHVSFVDAILLMAASPRPIRFIMDAGIFRKPVLGWVFRMARAIPIAPQRDDPAAFEAAFEKAAQVLRNGDLLGIFPEGSITRDGQLQRFRKGLNRILHTAAEEGLQVPVVPMALSNLWGSFFSRIEMRGGRNVAMVRPFRRGIFSHVGLHIGAAVPGSAATPAFLQQRVQALLEKSSATSDSSGSLP
ncbi:MFS transporter [Corticibacter populi]|uniref:MFS transporter n=1 Tax=Corticibacter populi TaxID=1550736 RepID=A0A3M6QKC9_9BURK|nr:MFS transporter [Corticibacter populi]RMX03538.1 MFS transporter [Corticibacter populi]RZS29989.1 1-acyl-sn-glycerol-3-phosphate acyltransferase [Corticibacter populi]